MKVLLALLGMAVVANFVWLFVDRQNVDLDFMLEDSSLHFTTEEADLEKILHFDPNEDGWFINGSQIQSLEPFLIEVRGDHHLLNLILVRISAEAPMRAYKRTMQALADQGICHMGFIDDSTQSEPGEPYEIIIHSVKNLKSDQGGERRCVDRFIPTFGGAN